MKKNPIAGYRVHFARLKNIRAEVSAIRTHKFKCSIPKETEKDLKNKFKNVAGVVDSSAKRSGFWFLLNLANMGILFPSAGNKYLLYKEKFGSSGDLGYPVPNQIALSKLLQTGINPANLEREMKVVWNLQKDDKLPSIAQSITQKIAEKVKKGAKLGSKATGFNQWAKDIFAEELKCPLLREVEKAEDIVIYNDLFLEWNREEVLKWIENGDIPEMNLDDTSYPWFFKNILPASEILGEKPIALLNPYHLMGKLLKRWKNNTDDLKEILEKQIPDSFPKKTELVSLLAKKVHEYATEVPPAEENDFITKSWAEYRETNFSGRLEGWISNFQNRLNAYEKHIADEYIVIDKKTREEKPEIGGHRKVFEIIEKAVDWKEFFPKKVAEDFEYLVNTRREFSNAINALKNSKKGGGNIGNLSFHYTSALQNVREFLMKLNNEGVKKEYEKYFKDTKFLETKKKKGEEGAEIDSPICGYWKKNMVPAELEKYPRFIGIAGKNPKDELDKAYKKIFGYVEAGNALIEAVKEKNKKEETLHEDWLGDAKRYQKILESLKNLAFVSKNPEKIWRFFEKYILNEKEKNSEEWKKKKEKGNRRFLHFYLSGYEKGQEKYRELSVKELSFEDFKEHFDNYFFQTNLRKKGDIQEFFGIGKEIKIENGELLKMRWGLELRQFGKEVLLPDYQEVFSPLKETSLSEILFEKDENFKTGIIPLPLFQRFVQSSIGSEIRGKLSLLSRKSFVERNVIQITNGNQSFLQYKPLEWGESSVESEKLQEKIIAIETKMAETKGKDSSKYAQLKRKLRRLKLANRSSEEKLKKKLHHLERDIETFKDDEKLVKILQRRKEKIQEKQQALSQGENPSFSKDAIIMLDSIGIEHQGKTNEEITDAIWKVFVKQKPEGQKALARVLGEIPHKWKMVLRTKQEIGDNFPKTEEEIFAIKKDQGGTFTLHDNVLKKIRPPKNEYWYSFPLETSAVQKQFLERFLWGDKSGVLTEGIMGSSVITEEEQKVIIDDDGVHIDLGKFSLYWAVPFQFSGNEKMKPKECRFLENTNIKLKNSEGKPQKQYRKEEKILGIDLGEYGFGWAIFDPKEEEFAKDKNGKELCGFIDIPLLKKMRLDAKDWKDTQSSGIFSRPTTHLADVREKAAGAVRNAIHALALKYDAIPVYEDSVDGFESGSQRISKLYKTIKTSDVIGGSSNEADATVRKHFWGDKFINIGGVIGSAMTSQTCRGCGRCATIEVQNLPEEKLKIVGKKIVGTNIFCKQEDGEYSKSDVRNAVKKEQRQPNPEKPGRGGDALFVCQICGNKTDADEQAAKNIALKYFFKITATEEEKEKFKDKKTGQFSSLKFFISKSVKWKTQ